MALDELIDQCMSIKRVHGGNIGVVLKQVVVEEPDCLCRHFTGCEKSTKAVDVEAAECRLVEGSCTVRKVVLR